MKFHTIQGKMESSWLEDVGAIMDKVFSFNMTLSEFKEAVIEKGLELSKKNGGRAWIVDSSEAVGTFNEKIQEFIGVTVFPTFAANGIKYFITLRPKKSALSEMTVDAFSEKTGPAGIILVEVDDVAQAIDFLKQRK